MDDFFCIAGFIHYIFIFYSLTSLNFCLSSGHLSSFLQFHPSILQYMHPHLSQCLFCGCTFLDLLFLSGASFLTLGIYIQTKPFFADALSLACTPLKSVFSCFCASAPWPKPSLRMHFRLICQGARKSRISDSESHLIREARESYMYHGESRLRQEARGEYMPHDESYLSQEAYILPCLPFKHCVKPPFKSSSPA